MTTLENSYCVPRDSEWDKFGLINLNGNIIIWRHGTWTLSDPTVPQGYSEIPVQHFIDLVEDRISSWRLEDAQFDKHPKDNKYAMKCEGSSVIVDFEFGTDVFAYCKPDIILFPNITTFTDLLTLIKFLTPPTK